MHRHVALAENAGAIEDAVINQRNGSNRLQAGGHLAQLAMHLQARHAHQRQQRGAGGIERHQQFFNRFYRAGGVARGVVLILFTVGKIAYSQRQQQRQKGEGKTEDQPPTAVSTNYALRFLHRLGLSDSSEL